MISVKIKKVPSLKMTRKIKLLSIITFLGILSSGHCLASDLDNSSEKLTIETITITAQKTEENIQDVPISVTTMTEMQIEDAGIRKTEDFIRHIPNVYIGTPGNHNGSAFVNLRGISTIPADMSANPAVGFYVDGVYYSGGVSTEFLDIERIEVLRGPQGTLYGRNTEAGVIHIITKKPSDYFEGKASVSFGSYKTQDYLFSVSGPAGQDNLYFSLTGKYLISEGFVENKYTGDDSSNEQNDLNIRAGLRWTPSDKLDINLISDLSRYRDGYDPFTPLDDLHISSINFTDAHDDQNSLGGNLTIQYIANSFTLTSISSLRHYDEDLANDMDMISTDIGRWYQDVGFDTISQEIRLSSPKDNGSFKWLAGAYYFNEDKTVDMIYDMRQGYPDWGIPPYKIYQDNDLETNGYAFFGQGTYTFLERLSLTGGLRFEHSSNGLKFKEYYEPDLSLAGMIPSNINPEDQDYDEILPKISVDYKLYDNLMSYASYAEGFKSGGLNIYGSSVAGIPYKPEYSTNYEIGVKSSWLKGSLTANLALFYIECEDQQVYQFVPAGTLIANAAESTSKGFEVELIAKPMTGLELNAAFGYTDVTFDKFNQPLFDTDMNSPTYGQAVGNIDLSGITNAFIPKYTYSIGAQYRAGNGFFGRIELQGVGEYWLDVENTKSQDTYTLLNARIGYESDLLDIVLWARNILDEEYVTMAVAPTSSYAGKWTGTGGDPLTFGITLTKRF